MRLVIQCVKQASVTVEGKPIAKIEKGILAFLGIHKFDLPETTHKLVKKLIQLRIFPDVNDKMNLSVQDVHGEILLVSQFTLYGNCNDGRRPDFGDAAPPAIAKPIYDKFVRELQQELGKVQTGSFGAMMQVHLINDGPITFILEIP